MRVFWAIFAGVFGALMGFLAAALFAIHALSDAGATATEEMMTLMSVAPYGVLSGIVASVWLTVLATKPGKPAECTQI